MIIEILKEAWRSLRANKLRSLLTTLGVIIGVAAVIVMMAISAGTEAAISESIYSLGSNLIFISSTFSRVGPGERPRTQAVWCTMTWQPSVRRSKASPG